MNTPSRNKELLAEITAGMKSCDAKTYFEVSPKLAKEIVEKRMSRNRIPSKGVVEKYADAMRRGKWSANIAPIIFLDDPGAPDHGFLIDGQHRLLAQVESGQAVWYPIYTVSRLDARYIDIGKLRTSAQNLAMFSPGGKDFDQFSPIVNHMFSIVRYFSGANYQMSMFKMLNEDQIMDIWKQSETIVRRTEELGVNKLFSQNLAKAFLCCIQLAGYSSRTDVFKQFHTAISGYVHDEYVNRCFTEFRDEMGNGHDTNRKSLRTLVKIWNYLIDETVSVEEFPMPSKLDIQALKGILKVSDYKKSAKGRVRRIK